MEGFRFTKLNFFIIFFIFCYHQNTINLLPTAIIFGKCRCNLAAVIPVKYKHDSTDLTDIFAKMNISLKENQLTKPSNRQPR